MPLKDLLVHVDTSDAGNARLEYTLALAEAHGAHVAGVVFSPIGSLPYAGGLELQVPPPQEYFKTLEEKAQGALDNFMSMGEKRGVSVEPRLLEGAGIELPRHLAIHARHADLTVIGQPNVDSKSSDQLALFEDLLFSTGRPILIVPYVGAPAKPPELAMVAWDGSPTASRAVHDALPLLRKAKSVIIFVAEAKSRGAAHGAEPGADLARHLARHDVNAEVSRAPGADTDIGNLILSRSADFGADLIVMGGYHHSRLREFFLGGVTKTILEQMTVPVLMAH